MEWTVREEDGFEVSEAANGSGLMKKTISIPGCGAFIMWCPTIPHGMLEPWPGHLRA